MCSKLYFIIVVLVAVILAALATFLPADQVDYVIAVSRFFDIMLPILAVGALLKYICKGSKGCCSHCPTDDKNPHCS